MPRVGEEETPQTSHHLIGLSWSFDFPPQPSQYYYLSEFSLVDLHVLFSVFRCNRWERDYGICLLHFYWNQIQKPPLNFRFVCHLGTRSHFVFRLSKSCHLYN